MRRDIDQLPYTCWCLSRFCISRLLLWNHVCFRHFQLHYLYSLIFATLWVNSANDKLVIYDLDLIFILLDFGDLDFIFKVMPALWNLNLDRKKFVGGGGDLISAVCWQFSFLLSLFPENKVWCFVQTVSGELYSFLPWKHFPSSSLHTTELWFQEAAVCWLLIASHFWSIALKSRTVFT